MKATLELPDSLFARLETEAASRRVRVEDLLAAYVEAGLRAEPTPAPPGSTTEAGAPATAEHAAWVSEFKEMLARIRAAHPGFSAADRLPREELYDRHAVR